MWNRKIFIAPIILLIFLLSSVTLVVVQGDSIFYVSPGAFTAHEVPPLGRPYTIPETIIVWNRDNIDRAIFVTSEVPPENAITPGYEPIPNENWIRLIPSSSIIHENSYAQIKISINIPRQENLTGQKWEVWIPVERQPLPDEVGVLRPTVRMDIETTSELPPLSGENRYLVLMAVVLVVAVVAVGVGILARLRGIRGRALSRGKSRSRILLRKATQRINFHDLLLLC